MARYQQVPGTQMNMTDDEFWRRSVDKRIREHFEEESERARLDIEPSLNDYQLAEEHGEKHSWGTNEGYADAGDIAGG
jgi:hypothetical protein